MSKSDNEIRLKPKDGKTHVFFTEVVSTKIFDDINRIASDEVDRIITAVQDSGYEIVDIKFAHTNRQYIRVMVVYK